jgi:hypothetical protein
MATIELDTSYIPIRYVETLAPLRDMLILGSKRKEKKVACGGKRRGHWRYQQNKIHKPCKIVSFFGGGM